MQTNPGPTWLRVPPAGPGSARSRRREAPRCGHDDADRARCQGRAPSPRPCGSSRQRGRPPGHPRPVAVPVRVPVPASVRSFASASRTRAGGTDPAAPLVRDVAPEEEPRGSRAEGAARPARSSGNSRERLPGIRSRRLPDDLANRLGRCGLNRHTSGRQQHRQHRQPHRTAHHHHHLAERTSHQET